MFSIAQRCLRILAHLDLLLFFAVFFGSGLTEFYICDTKPISLSNYHHLDYFGFLPISNNSNNVNISGCGYASDSKFCDNHQNNQSTIWDYRLSLLDQVGEHGRGLYHIAHFLCWVIIGTYFVLETTQYFVLVRGINLKRSSYLYKWIGIRFLILAIALTLIAYDLSGLQVTCTDIFVLPLAGFRLIFLLAVIIFSTRMRVGSSSETIVMTGNEKF